MCIKLRKSKKNLETAICLRTIFSMINQLKKKRRSRETKPNIRENPKYFHISNYLNEKVSVDSL